MRYDLTGSIIRKILTQPGLAAGPESRSIASASDGTRKGRSNQLVLGRQFAGEIHAILPEAAIYSLNRCQDGNILQADGILICSEGCTHGSLDTATAKIFD
jgi:hypothetical protein